MATLGEDLEAAANVALEELRKRNVQVSYTVSGLRMSGYEARMTLRLRAFPLGQECPECGKPVTVPVGEWRNDPRQTGVRYICPGCYLKIRALGGGA